MKKMAVLVILSCIGCICFIANDYCYAQTTMLSSVEETLQAPPVQLPAITEFQLQTFLMQRLPPLPRPASAEQWTTEEKRLRA